MYFCLLTSIFPSGYQPPIDIIRSTLTWILFFNFSLLKDWSLYSTFWNRIPKLVKLNIMMFNSSSGIHLLLSDTIFSHVKIMNFIPY